MVRFVPEAGSMAGRLLKSLGRLVGLRSETVYSRAILLMALMLFVVVGASVVLVWQAVVRQFESADEQALLSTAVRVREILAANPDASVASRVEEISAILGQQIFFRSGTADVERTGEGISIRKLPDGSMSAVFPVAGGGGHLVGEVVISGVRSFYEAGNIAVRVFIVGVAVVGGIMLLLMLFVVDRTVLARIQLLSDKVEHEKRSERLPVRLDVSGDDEIAQLAASIEELARLVQAAEREYRNVVEDQTECICRFDAEERITFSNRAFESLCVQAPAGRRPSLEGCLDARTLRLLQDTLEQLGPARTVTSFTHEVAPQGTAPSWYRSTLRANFDDSGVFAGGQWVAADVTSEVSAQKKLQASQQQLALLSGRLMNLQDEERRRIARDLHDSTAQSLSALEMNTSILESLASDDKTRKLAGETRAISRQVCKELRNISYLLHPPLLEEKGLVFAIRWFADGFTKRNNIPVILELPEGFPRMRSDEETALFRIVQEALSNIYRHAGATKAWITLQKDDDSSVLLEIRDNGEGLPEGFSLARSSGVGLAGMHERMKQLGGSLDVVSSDYGVSVKCRLGAADRKLSATDERG